ncbi:MAG: discoidin domain-containing protein [Prevotella sp.]|jgi:hypothetical protein|nr:discoidin domain-containing protein [Prevotella sp.]
MKQLYITLIAISAMFATACNDMLDDIKPYLDEGEKVYVGKLDSVKIFSGQNRLKITGLMPYGMTQTKCILNWIDPAGEIGSKEYPIERVSPNEQFEFIIDNLLEGQYDFQIYTYDAKNNSSIRVDIGGYSYGEVYESVLVNRNIGSMSLDEDGGTINWLAGANGLVRSEIKYTDKEGTIRNISVSVDESSIYCPGAPGKGEFEYRSVYIPEKLSIDEFYTAWDKASFPYLFGDVDRSQWSVIFCDNSDPTEGSPDNIIDNNPDSYWHSDYHNATNYPYTFVIDMKEQVWVGEIGAQTRQNAYYTRGVEFYTIDNYTGPSEGQWIKLGDLDLPQNNNDIIWKTCSNSILDAGIKARYLKVVLTSGYNGHLGGIGEISVKKVLY